MTITHDFCTVNEDMGPGLGDSSREPKEVLVPMAVGMREHWKVPISFHLTRGANAEQTESADNGSDRGATRTECRSEGSDIRCSCHECLNSAEIGMQLQERHPLFSIQRRRFMSRLTTVTC